jgi:hypothetical protein
MYGISFSPTASIEKAEIELFKKMLLAFGYTQASFKPYFNILQIKNNKPEEDRYSNRNM